MKERGKGSAIKMVPIAAVNRTEKVIDRGAQKLTQTYANA